MFFYVHQSHRHDNTHPSLLTSWGVLWESLACSYDISHSRTQQVSITSLAATSVSQTVTHPSTKWAQSHLTSVIGLWVVTPCQWDPMRDKWEWDVLNTHICSKAVVCHWTLTTYMLVGLLSEKTYGDAQQNWKSIKSCEWAHSVEWTPQDWKNF